MEVTSKIEKDRSKCQTKKRNEIKGRESGRFWDLIHLTSKQAFFWKSSSWSSPVTPADPSDYQMDSVA